eukprot:Hpha_TRINITY_DN15991_c0_g5::TRINITY_DN15991_c0_g5_i10::g.74643::m.74643
MDGAVRPQGIVTLKPVMSMIGSRLHAPTPMPPAYHLQSLPLLQFQQPAQLLPQLPAPLPPTQRPAPPPLLPCSQPFLPRHLRLRRLPHLPAQQSPRQYLRPLTPQCIPRGTHHHYPRSTRQGTRLRCRPQLRPLTPQCIPLGIRLHFPPPTRPLNPQPRFRPLTPQCIPRVTHRRYPRSIRQGTRPATLQSPHQRSLLCIRPGTRPRCQPRLRPLTPQCIPLGIRLHFPLPTRPPNPQPRLRPLTPQCIPRGTHRRCLLSTRQGTRLRCRPWFCPLTPQCIRLGIRLHFPLPTLALEHLPRTLPHPLTRLRTALRQSSGWLPRSGWRSPRAQAHRCSSSCCWFYYSVC